MALFFATVHAQEAPTKKTTWGISAGWNQYTEPDLMQLTGPEVGIYGRLTLPNNLHAEAEGLIGKQNYSSNRSGNLDNVANIETRWRLMTPIWEERVPGILVGLGYHTLWNDLRGQTNTGHVGYQRIANQLWMPVRWSVSSMWQIDAGLLIYGRHRSNLSEAGGTDIVNTQRNGQYLQIAANLDTDSQHTLTPFIRYTHLGNSNVVNGGYEPTSVRWQTGVIWTYGHP